MGTERNQTRLLVGMASMQTPSFVVSDRCSSVFCLSRAYSYFSTGCAILQVDIMIEEHAGGARGCEDPKGLRDLWGLSLYFARGGTWRLWKAALRVLSPRGEARGRAGGYGKPPYVCCRREAGRGDAKTPKVSETFGVCPLLRVRGYVAAMGSRPTCAVAARRGEGTGGRLWKAALRVLSPRGGARGWAAMESRPTCAVAARRGEGAGGYGKPPYVCCRREAGRGGREDPKGLRDLWGLSFASRAGVRGG